DPSAATRVPAAGGRGPVRPRPVRPHRGRVGRDGRDGLGGPADGPGRPAGSAGSRQRHLGQDRPGRADRQAEHLGDRHHRDDAALAAAGHPAHLHQLHQDPRGAGPDPQRPGAAADPEQPGARRAGAVPEPLHHGAGALADERPRAPALPRRRQEHHAGLRGRRRAAARVHARPVRRRRADAAHQRRGPRPPRGPLRGGDDHADPGVRPLRAQAGVHHRLHRLHPLPGDRHRRQRGADGAGHDDDAAGDGVAALQAPAVRPRGRLGAGHQVTRHELRI
ncbi:MAG: Flagellar biosynthesis protein FliP, partial [uncultured Nocardioides sp.]